MSGEKVGAREVSRVRVRAEGGVSAEALAYVREKVTAVLDRSGLPPASGEVRIARAAAHHAERPWSAVADLKVGASAVVVHAEEPTSQELADRLRDRLRRRMTHVLAAHGGGHTADPPPWRGGRPGVGHVTDEGERERPGQM
ncbi:hypothetical protein [Streptomyces buecherae]|uniref:hypothetical protein n=1 Tax=Streptomyces buecherae TaxID=2763006 RepID=UPI003682154D